MSTFIVIITENRITDDKIGVQLLNKADDLTDLKTVPTIEMKNDKVKHLDNRTRIIDFKISVQFLMEVSLSLHFVFLESKTILCPLQRNKTARPLRRVAKVSFVLFICSFHRNPYIYIYIYIIVREVVLKDHGQEETPVYLFMGDMFPAFCRSSSIIEYFFI